MKKNAFTLIEILAVLIIISILVILSIPSLSDMLEKSKEKSKREVIEMVKTAAEMYAIDYKIGLAEPIYITDLCKNYIKCPIKDPITDQPITGYLYSRIDKNNSYSRVFELKTGTPIILNDSILSTVGGKDISINKYSGNGLYKWGD
jgi:prepilin-type N-terminal cleavage/methylation domain-containing protein